MRKRFTIGSSALVLFTTLVMFITTAPVLGASEGDEGREDDYIVVLKESANSNSVSDEHRSQHGADVRHVYHHALRGYSARLSEQELSRIRQDPRVDYVELDRPVSIDAQTNPTGIQRVFATNNGNIDIDGADDLRVDADVAVIDTGIDYDHPDLNVVHRADCTTSPIGGPCTSDAGDDGNGHGSHVAGTIGAIDNGFGVVGVAPGVRLWAIRALDNNGNGWVSDIIAGVDYLTARAATIEVANLSLSGPSPGPGAECSAIANSINAGIVYAAAAGNSNQNVDGFSPANCARPVITTSAIADFNGFPGGGSPATCRLDQDDTKADFSNWGTNVEIAAPGVCILSTYMNGAYATFDGTSMASPHVAGAAALLASRTNPSNSTDVTNILNTLTLSGNFNWSDESPDGMKEPLLDVSSTSTFQPVMVPAGPGPTPTPTPTSTPTSTPPPGDAWQLSLQGSQTAQKQVVRLRWNSSATSATQVDVYRDGAKIVTTANDGVHKDVIKGGTGQHTYQVCQAGSTANCSQPKTIF